MHKNRAKTSKHGVALQSIGIALAVILFQSGIAFGGMWGKPWMKSNQSWSMAQVNGSGADTGESEMVEAQGEEMTAMLVATPNPKLFWFENCSSVTSCPPHSSSLWFVDPEAATPVKTLFASGIVGTNDTEPFIIPTGNLDLNTYQMTNLEIGYVFYFQGGKIWLVDTTTLAKKQVSTENGITTEGSICEGKTLVNWQHPLYSMLYYVKAGPDGQCWTGDDKHKLVALNMTATDNPVDVGMANIDSLLFNDKSVVVFWANSTGNVAICSSPSDCQAIDTFQSNAWAEDYDASRVLLMVDGKLKIYDYKTLNKLTTLYVPAAKELIAHRSLDRDGFVYFWTATTVSPSKNTIKKVPVNGGSVTTLATFNTAAPLDDDMTDFDITPSHVVYSYPNSTLTGKNVYSVPKGGGTPLLLANSHVLGGVGGPYLFSEDNSGKMTRVNVNGTEKLTKTNTQLNGCTLGGSSDWHYGFAPSARIFLSSIDNKVRSYGATENFTTSTAGLLLGTLPVNLNNFEGDGTGVDMLGTGKRRQAEFSKGEDILLLNAATASSLKRLTNSNSNKGPLSKWDN